QLLRFRTAHAEPGFVSIAAPVRPAVAEAEMIGHLSQIGDRVLRIIYSGFANRIVRPCRRRLKVVDVMAQAAKPDHKVRNLPGDARERLGGEIAEDDEAERSHVRALPIRGPTAGAAEDKPTTNRNSGGARLHKRPATQNKSRGGRRETGW